MTWNLLRHSFSLKGLVQSSKKSQRKRKSLKRYRAKCIKQRLHGKYYKMFASKNDRSKWPARREFDQTSPWSGWTLSIDWLLFWALFCIEWFQFLFLMVWQWQQRTILKLWIYENHIIFMWTAEWRILLHVFEEDHCSYVRKLYCKTSLAQVAFYMSQELYLTSM